ncbi:MAG: hypothetical protein Q7S21_06460 [archaeon]|nr:hypothetical protein [archaeon]
MNSKKFFFVIIFFSIIFSIMIISSADVSASFSTCNFSAPILSSSISFGTCGNGICESDEDRCNCVNDCGECIGSVANTLCEQYTCLTGLCRATVVYQCCGNQICEPGENYSVCSRDCAPRDISIELVDFDSSKVYMRGDEVTVKAIVRGDGALVKDAAVNLQGFMGSVVMRDDGLEGDVEANNGVYTVVFVVPTTTEKDLHEVTIVATKEATIEQYDFIISVDPALELSANFNKQQFVLGDIVDVNGFIKKRGSPLETSVAFSAELNGTKVFSQTVDSDENGFFKTSYHTSLIEGKGNWHFKVEAKDTSNNIGLVENALLVTDASGTAFLNIEFVSPDEKVLQRRDSLRIIVNVLFDNSPVDDAVVSATFLNNDSVKLKNFASGKYSGNYIIPDNSELGEQKIIVNAAKKVDEITYTGTISKDILVKEVPIMIEMISPDRSLFGLGETVDFRFKLSYPGNTPVIGAKFDLLVNDVPVQVTESSEGIYSASYALLDASTNSIEVVVSARDVFNNSGIFDTHFEMEKSLSIDYYFRRYPLPFLAAIIVIIAGIIIVTLVRRKKLMVGSLEKRRQELLKLKKELQDKYFNQQSISNEEYYFLLEKYSSELRALDSAIGSFAQKKGKQSKEAVEKKILNLGEEKESSIMDDDAPVRLFSIKKDETLEQKTEEKADERKKEKEKKKNKK